MSRERSIGKTSLVRERESALHNSVDGGRTEHKTSDNDALVERIRAEYLEMPGMTLRLEQVARLPDGAYARMSGEMTHRPRPAKATLDSYTPAHVRRRAR
jgi:hypothetical protein